MIPSASHPWSPWRPVAVAGWVIAGVLAWGALYAVATSLAYASHRADACRIRWGTVKSAADSVRVANDCGLPGRAT